MTKLGKFRAQINAVESLLADLKLLQDRNHRVTYPRSLPSEVRDLTYVEEFWFYVNNGLFDVRLTDHGLLQFKVNTTDEVSYCFYESPQDVPTYREFLVEHLGSAFEDIEAVGDTFHDEYDLVVSTARLRAGVTPVRYDYCPRDYEAGIHPAAHLHIGTNNSIRLACARRMSPISFALFVVRQMYPGAWRRLLDRPDASFICREVRHALPVVDETYLQDPDRLQLVLE